MKRVLFVWGESLNLEKSSLKNSVHVKDLTAAPVSVRQIFNAKSFFVLNIYSAFVVFIC